MATPAEVIPIIVYEWLRESKATAFKDMGVRQKAAIRLHLGLDADMEPTHQPMSHKQVGEHLGVLKTAARSLIHGALIELYKQIALDQMKKNKELLLQQLNTIDAVDTTPIPKYKRNTNPHTTNQCIHPRFTRRTEQQVNSEKRGERL